MHSNETRHTILIVDHDVTNLRLARRVLETAGFEVCDARDAVSTFEVLKGCRPAMIVLDVQLPGMDGWELARRLKTNFATRMIPIIVMTAFGRESDRDYALSVGCAEFVEKPISSVELPAIVRRHLDISRLAQPPREAGGEFERP